MTASHRRVQHLQVEYGFGRVQRKQLGMSLGDGTVVAPQVLRLVLERLQALFGQRLQSPVDDQVDELLRREEAAAVLAGIAVGAHDYPAIVVPDRLTFQEPLVDGAKLLHGHVTVVDEVACALSLRMAQVVDDVADNLVRKAGRLEQRGGFGCKQAAVVGRQADGLVALVDLAEQRHQVVVVAGGAGGEDGAPPCILCATWSRTGFRKP